MVEIDQEQLKNMSPEQMKEMQKQNCIFCHIINGKVQSRKVYEDEKCIAVLDINPANPGHILLLPREHYMIMPQIPDSGIGHLFMVAKHLSHSLLKALKAQGTNIFVANGAIAGQRSPHLMIHIVPRMENDGLSNFNVVHKRLSEEEYNKIKKQLAAKIGEAFGVKKVIEEEKPAVIKSEPSIKEKKKEAAAKEEKEEEKHAKQSKQKKPKKNAKPAKKEVDLDKLTEFLAK